MAKSGQGKRGRRTRKRRFVRMSLLNVRAHPHNDGSDTYRKLWQAAIDLGITVAFHGDKKAKIAYGKEDSDKTIVGDIWTYTKVGREGGVVNLPQGRVLKQSEFARIDFDWDAHGFNPQFIQYAFDLRSHRVGFEIKPGQSPRFLQGVIEAILNTPAVRAKAGVAHVSVEVEQEEKRLDEILGLKLDRLKIVVTKPNPDDLADLEEEFRELLEEQHAESQALELKAEKGSQLQPSERTQRIARLALSNGSVEGHGRDPETNRARTLETMEAPLQDGAYLVLALEDTFVHLARRTREIAGAIRARLRKNRE